MKLFIFILLAAALLVTGCSNAAKQNAAYQKTIDSLTAVINTDRTGDAHALAKADSLWSAATFSTGAEGLLSYYAPGVIQLPPNNKITGDEQGIEKIIKGIYVRKEAHILWKSTKVEVARSGELGYVTGKYTLMFKDAKDKQQMEVGRYSEVWKKQTDGSWKAISDVWSAGEKGIPGKDGC